MAGFFLTCDSLSSAPSHTGRHHRRNRHTDNFQRTLEKLIDAAESVDKDHMICDALLNGLTLLSRYFTRQGEFILDIGANIMPVDALAQ